MLTSHSEVTAALCVEAARRALDVPATVHSICTRPDVPQERAAEVGEILDRANERAVRKEHAPDQVRAKLRSSTGVGTLAPECNAVPSYRDIRLYSPKTRAKPAWSRSYNSAESNRFSSSSMTVESFSRVCIAAWRVAHTNN